MSSMRHTDTHPDVDPDPGAGAGGGHDGRASLPTVAASALALGALALPEPARLSPGPRHLLRLGRAAYVGWYTWDLTRRTPIPPVQPQVLGAVAGAGLTLASAPVDETTDAWITDRLRRLGVRRPRLAMALAAAGMGGLLALDNQVRHDDDDEDLMEPDDFFETGAVPPAARVLVEAMLDAAADDAAGAQTSVLREQLGRAQGSVLADGVPSTDVFFEVPDDTPRVVPHHQTWPVRGHLEAGDLPLQLELQIGEGRLAGLSIMLRDADLADDDERWEVEIFDVLPAWPSPEQVRWVVETPEGFRPVQPGR